ncbi:MAG: glycerol-3-phosphate 1-O-acyltransferase PlsY [Pigeon pea little leaf phytoplasma]|uniref:glycerol-3-phosphate 1-O-acyltransferase PlsY n=1 Tax=Candidatus Phytoplasma fabacearum TaxID=2982628 RepID=UPI002712A3FF|nr:glycerol-3-phosphate 1-O-acyltransferase PlsY ['Bituminaria bituminosa' little leaf phytoplasma]MDO8023885.1 glycerol-3-phosphate 1-O-acyltransferase PlsY ['Bituminaria bituminosa' little leaf phytoplasma]MDV3158482.1 glycerol-3-phosphate 1-O-acyltransferase PlsY [Pigeon pea little leaf phytoplasma]MDV3161423.1 glycerol-3-phosphate 1-O-acyltransferase PlsY [Pigeon pea little leaf phytoplasma]
MFQLSLTNIIICITCYIIGSIPFGLLIGIFNNRKINLLGSKNIGASNVTRILGFKYGLLTFLLDFLKGFLPVFIFKNSKLNLNFPQEKTIILGICAILGHMFSIFNRFKGGKAIATSVGVVAGINFWSGFFGIIIFIFLVKITGYASLSSLIATIITNINLYITNQNTYNSIAMAIITILIFIKHKKNIIQLYSGTENKFNIKHKKINFN